MNNAERQKAYRDRVKARKHELADVAPAIIAGWMPERPKPQVDFRPLRKMIDAMFEARAIGSIVRAQLRNEISRLEHG